MTPVPKFILKDKIHLILFIKFKQIEQLGNDREKKINQIFAMFDSMHVIFFFKVGQVEYSLDVEPGWKLNQNLDVIIF